MQRWRKWLTGDFTYRRLLLTVLEIYLCLLAWAWFYTDWVAFQPPPATYAEGGDTYRIATPSGQQIAVRMLPNPAAEQVILFAHGNAEDLGDLGEFMEAYRAAGFEIYAFDYQGYGISEGRPSIGRAYEDIETVYQHMVHEREIAPGRIIVHGRSLGAAFALHLASRYPVGGVIVESGFVTAFRVLTRIPLFPLDRIRNDWVIKRVHCPVLVIHGVDDAVIEFWHGHRLLELAPEPKFGYWVNNAGHNDVIMVEGIRYWQRIREFADDASSAEQKQSQVR